MTHTVRLRGVTRTFKDVTAIRDLDIALEPGRIYGLLGPNGSGKTTSVRTMLGLCEPDSGEVELLGAPPSDGSRARVGFVPEQRGLPESAKVRPLLEFFARMRGFSRADARARAEEWIDRMELGDKAGHRVKTLSNGQQQKVQIALALLCEPEVILMDEPLAALDPQHQDLIVERIRAAAANGATVLLSTHRLREAQDIIGHVLMLFHGVKVLDRPLASALEDAFDGTWRIRCEGDGTWVPGPDVVDVRPHGDQLLVRLSEPDGVAALLGRAAASGVRLHSIERVLPSLHELYLARARAFGPEAAPSEGAA